MSTLKMPQVDMSTLKQPGPVTSVIAAWEPAVSNGEHSMRGFGGRVYLYDQEMTRPVRAKGALVVYIFEEDGRSPNNAKPDEGIVFSEKMLNSKGIYKKSKLGHSYNLWVPIDAAGPDGAAKKVSLIVRYMPEKGGASVVSSQATAHLPGRHSPALMADYFERHESGSIQQASASRSPLSQERRRSSEHTDRLQTMQAVTIR
jgi:hypothetical protein